MLATIDLEQFDDDADRGFFARAQPVFAAHGLAKDDPVRGFDEASPRFLVEARVSGAEVIDVQRIRWDQTYTTEQYRDLLNTFSNFLMLPEAQRRAAVDDICDLVDREFDGQVVRPLAAVLVVIRPPR